MIKYYDITENELSNKEYEAGSIYYCYDTLAIYYDSVSENKRICVNNIMILLDTESNRTDMLSPIPYKFYYIKESNKIYIYNSEWVCINKYVELDSTLTIEGKAADAKAVGDRLNALGELKDGLSIFYIDSDISYNENGFNIVIIKRLNFVDNGREVQIGDLVISKNGTICTVTSVDSTDIHFKPVSNISGSTPVKGTDYWTDEDKAEIKAYVDEAILGGVW